MARYVQCPKDGQREYISDRAEGWIASGLTPVAWCGFCGDRLPVTADTIREGE